LKYDSPTPERLRKCPSPRPSPRKRGESERTEIVAIAERITDRMGLASLQTHASQPSAGKRGGLRECPACGGMTAHTFRFRVNGCDILQCAECGLGRTETPAFDPATYYTEDYFSGRRADGYADYLGAEPVLRREFSRSVDFIRRYRNGGKLLELGCAYGFFLKEAARYFDVAGIELAPEAAAHAHRAGLNVLHGAADAANLQRIGKVDVIALFDVIEHLPQPRETLALCRDHLNPGGIIVITTGIMARWRRGSPARAGGS
jgi:hypothetical protein